MLRFALAGLVAAVVLIVWPLRLEQALWAVTVGDGPTKHVPVRGGKLVTPLRMLVNGVPREAASLRSAVRARAIWALTATGFAVAAGLVEVARRKRPR